MAVTAAAFKVAGGGRLNPNWFDTDLDSLLSIWIAAAEPGSDEIVTARVYARAFTILADQAYANPVMERDRNETTQWSVEQYAYWAAQAKRYAAEADALVGLVAGPVFTLWEGNGRGGIR